MALPRSISTYDGSTVEIFNHGVEYELVLRTAKGDTIATVYMGRSEVVDLVADAIDIADLRWL
ncbi:hypothetical protein LHJ74_30780 [Streptomyces sp. N2-109]|uniref:Uncharacterized protein n=1 Tax=Streptomyces gossypii TaxID=2883101 RepID=A0ABT2K239_9ACTN|nr:hypothetical protein [Streptomyces gossypii]MCT2594242.1 hypothetical protein [Streptomyces gossypii]